MRNNKNKGFTLVELIAVLVILAFIALIVTPLVMNIVKKAKHSANERSVDAYGKALELSVANYLLEHKEYPTTLEGLKVEYTGSEVNCLIKTLNEDGSIYLSECSVGGIEVKNSKEEDGYYHYGKTSGAFRSYKVGDVVIYNGINFYVIEASDKKTDTVKLLKKEPLKTTEMGSLISSTEILNYVDSSEEFLKVPYYAKDNCVSGGDTSGCTTDYNVSSVKQVVDVWANAKLTISDLKEDSLGYKTRLITYNELINNLGYAFEQVCTADCYQTTIIDNVPTWVYNDNYAYWTMSAYEDSDLSVWRVQSNGGLSEFGVANSNIVRPVITLLKSAI